MVSVLAAFALLLLAVAMLSTAMAAARNMLVKTEQNDRKYTRALEEFYREYEAGGALDGSEICFRSGDGERFFVKGSLKEVETADGGLHFFYYQYPSKP